MLGRGLLGKGKIVQGCSSNTWDPSNPIEIGNRKWHREGLWPWGGYSPLRNVDAGGFPVLPAIGLTRKRTVAACISYPPLSAPPPPFPFPGCYFLFSPALNPGRLTAMSLSSWTWVLRGTRTRSRSARCFSRSSRAARSRPMSHPLGASSSGAWEQVSPPCQPGTSQCVQGRRGYLAVGVVPFPSPAAAGNPLFTCSPNSTSPCCNGVPR